VLAVTHTIPDNFDQCVTTHISKLRPDLELARRQWDSYCQRLRSIGCKVHVLQANSHLPDAPFVEDTGVVVGNLFVGANLKAPSRRPEASVVASYFADTHDVVRLKSPAFLDGGDVLRVGNHFFVGQSERTNREGFEQFQAIVSPLGYKVVSIKVSGCLHLKTAITALDEETLLLNPRWVSADDFSGYRILRTPESEPSSANILRIQSHLTGSSGCPQRDDLLGQAGYELGLLDISELAKAEAGLTCLSLLVESSLGAPPRCQT
jgi:dimethylargininase